MNYSDHLTKQTSISKFRLKKLNSTKYISSQSISLEKFRRNPQHRKDSFVEKEREREKEIER